MKQFIVVVLLPFIACHANKVREVVIDKNLKAVGNISVDTMYNGLIKFYNIQSNKLVSECNYLNGIENGPRIDYFENGQRSLKVNYSDGKVNGVVSSYDEYGELLQESYQYYGIHVGANLLYRHGKVTNYNFYSFDGKKLISLNYDSVGTKRIIDVIQNYFFFNIQSYQTDSQLDKKSEGVEVFLYTPKLPLYDFKYSLVEVNEKLQVDSELEKFDSNQPWVQFSVDVSQLEKKRLAIRLTINDVNDKGKLEMIKVL